MEPHQGSAPAAAIVASQRRPVPMSRDKTLYSCAECGGTTPKWLGQCPHCRAWNTLTEALAEPATARNRYGQGHGHGHALNAAQPVAPLSAIEASEVARAANFTLSCSAVQYVLMLS